VGTHRVDDTASSRYNPRMRFHLAALVALVGCSGKIAEAPPFAPSSVECTTPPDAETTCALCGDGWHCPTGLLPQCPAASAALSPQGDPVQGRTETSRVAVMLGDCISCVDGVGTELSYGETLGGELETVAPVAPAVQFPCAP
jgi:hypothetical protein